MRIVKLLSVLVAVVGLGFVVLLAAPSVYEHPSWSAAANSPQAELDQGTPAERNGRAREFTILSGRGAEIGVTIRDLGSSDAGAGKADARTGGVLVEEVRPDGPAEKAGIKRSDVIVEFDGEHVRSARQFTRLVQETAPGRTVKATVVRDGQRKEIQLTPSEGRDAVLLDGERLRERLGDLGRFADHLPPFNFDFDLGLGGLLDTRGRLGVSVEELTPQLAAYFGAKEGVLVSTVSDDSPASRAGLKAGDVITRVNGEPVRARADLLRALRDAGESGEMTIGIVRDKKESTITAKIEQRQTIRHGRRA